MDYATFGNRLAEPLLRKRMRKQADHVAELVHQGEGILRLEEYIDVDALLTFLFKAFGIYRRGHRNYLDVQVVHQELRIAGLPAGLEGFRLLQLSDLHLDLDSSLTPVLQRLLKDLDYDIAVLTGDYRNCTRRDFRPCLDETAKVLAALRMPAYGILGNHDFIEMAPGLESAGLRLLLNESVIVTHREACLFLAGIDDPHFYRTHDIARASQGMPPGATAILLSHSPETYREAEAAGFHVMLAGHTHGGQICLPGGIPILRVANCPSRMLAGAWNFGNLQGYTSRGTGSTGVPARFFCRPEITIHTLLPSPI
jgi:predicted MPP superfamily phosphohydrolase